MLKSRTLCYAILLASQAFHSYALPVKILGINDFHGQISEGRLVNNQPAGGAAVLAAYLKQSTKDYEGQTLIAFTGDQTGASPPVSALLNDEPAIAFFNALGNASCTATYQMNPECNLVATIGNHEFDKGLPRLFHLIYGTDGRFEGARFPHVSANIVDATTHQPLFPPYVIKEIRGIRIAFIGAILKNARDTMFAKNAEGVEFLDEAESINAYLPELKAQGINTFVVLIHEGGNQIPYEGATHETSDVNGAIVKIVQELDDSIDVVMCGHTHQFLNAYIKNKNGKEVLITQANSYSVSYAEVLLDIDPGTQKVTRKSARIITTYAHAGLLPDRTIAELVKGYEDIVAPMTATVIGETKTALLRNQNLAGESNLGNLVADAYKDAMDSDIAVTNIHGIRDDIAPGTITKGMIYSVLPFANQMVKLSLTGREIQQLLEQQWMGGHPNILQISGMSYAYNPAGLVGHKVQWVKINEKPLDMDKRYTIATTNFVASGDGVFTVMKQALWLAEGASDQDTVIGYIQKFNGSVDTTSNPRIILWNARN